jgi:hypothetical protein
MNPEQPATDFGTKLPAAIISRNRGIVKVSY